MILRTPISFRDSFSFIQLHTLFNDIKDKTPYIINITMPASLVNSDEKQEIGDGYFDLLWKSVSEEDKISTSASSSDYETVE